MESAFDAAKNKANLAKHGLSLAFGSRVFEDDDHLVLPSIRPVDGEDRYKAVGLVEDKLFTAVYVTRDGMRRFISVRRSNDGEERAYRDQG